MKTRRFFATCMMATLLCSGIFAQEQNTNEKAKRPQRPTAEEIATKQTEGMQHKLLLDDATAEKFAPIYKEYLTALQKCKQTTDKKKQKELTDAEIAQRIENRFATQKQIIETKETYYKKLKKVLNARQLEVVFSQKENHPQQGCPMGGKQDCKQGGAPRGMQNPFGPGPQMQPQAPQNK